ncbi:MAG: tRNA (adenosine(37)-N6)-threonylcarbamoyltransferase complex dimerization subunit type 1 TsaB [Aureispira sp.]
MPTYILAIETTTHTCSIALIKDGYNWIVRQDNQTNGHAQHITLFIQEVMATAQMALSELDAIAISQGPGSYTGLRIGLSTAKGLCYALDKPLLAIDSLQALAWGGQETQGKKRPKVGYVSLMDARRMDAYVGVYDANLQLLAKPYFATLATTSFDQVLLEHDLEALVVTGDASAKFIELFEGKLPTSLIWSGINAPSARYMSALAQLEWQEERFQSVAYFEPFYLKKPHITRAKPKL